MTKAKLLKIVNLILFLCALVQITGGFLMIFSIPFPSLGEIHEYSGMALSAMIVIHLILNWTWVKNTFFSKKNPVQKGS